MELDTYFSGQGAHEDILMVTDEQDERYARVVLKAMEHAPIELFDRAPKFRTLEEINEALQEGIYDD